MASMENEKVLKKISISVDLEFFQRITKAAQDRGMSISAFIKMIVGDFLEKNEKIDKSRMNVKSISYTNIQKEKTEELEIIDIDSHKLKKVANKFNNDLNQSQEVENEYRKLLRMKKRKENNYGNT